VDFENTQVSIIYNKDGIVKLYIWGLRDFSYSDESVTLLPFDDVVESLKTHFEGIMDDNTYEVVDAVLVSDSLESASDECEIIPVWAFYYYEYFPEYPDNPGKYTIRVNAETGQIVIHNIGVE
jgi:hypothetical protein